MFSSEGYAFCQSSNTKIMVTPMQILSCNSPQHFIVFLILSPGRNVRSVPGSAIVPPNFVAVFVPFFFFFYFRLVLLFPSLLCDSRLGVFRKVLVWSQDPVNSDRPGLNVNVNMFKKTNKNTFTVTFYIYLIPLIFTFMGSTVYNTTNYWLHGVSLSFSSFKHVFSSK